MRILDIVFSESYYQLTLLYLNINDLTQAETYQKKLHEYSIENQAYYSNIVNAQDAICQALLLIHKKTFEANFLAQKSLQQVVNNSNLKKELIIDAILPLIRLTIEEFKLLKNPVTFDKIKGLIVMLKDLANNMLSIPTKIHSLLIQGNLELIHGNIKSFESNYKLALDMADEYQLDMFKELITSRLTEFRNEMQNWKNIINEDINLVERFEKIDLFEYIKLAKHLTKE